ncbi:CDP-paratose 2-epimerase [mine drainage metagenome]|uniref:CDP-paratose 2-epimerase n=1 Tax=mine drainage metagenome TaxID=410659 RepID=A0A1J5REE4_9ZZZZ
MTTSLTNPLRDFRTNALGTLNLLEAVRSYSPDTFVAYSSTNKVYGDLKKIRYTEGPTRYQAADFPDGFDESMPLDFASPYGCSKGSADQYVRDWYRNFGLKTVVFRHSSIYGGRQYATIDQGWIGWFCRQAIEQLRDKTVKPFTIAGSGKQVRDVLHAEDLIRLYRSAFEHRNEIAGEVFNIGGGMRNSLSLLELFALLEDVLDIDGKLRFNMGPRRKSDQDFFVADVGKVQRLLGWTPNVNTSEGISRMLEWAEGLSSD